MRLARSIRAQAVERNKVTEITSEEVSKRKGPKLLSHVSPECPPASQEQAGAHASTGDPTPPLTPSRAPLLEFQRNFPTPSTFFNRQEVSERGHRYISDLAETRMHSICFVTGQKWKLLPQGRNIKQRQNKKASSGETCKSFMSLLLLAGS